MFSRIILLLTLYYPILLGVYQIALTINKDYFSTPFYLIIALVLGILPILTLLLFKLSARLTKLLRILTFKIVKIKLLSIISIIILGVFSVFIIINMVINNFIINQISLNILFLNIIIIVFLTLIYSGKFVYREALGLLIRQHGHGEVYLFIKGVLKHIPDPSTLQLLGYSFKEVNEISEKEFLKYNITSPLESITNARIINALGKPEIYMVIADEIRHIPDPTTLNVIQQLRTQAGNNTPIESIDQNRLSQWPIGIPLKSLIRD